MTPVHPFLAPPPFVAVAGLLLAASLRAAIPVDYNVTDFGAVGDGHTPATAPIQRAIDACAAAGGGRVILPPGTYLSGPLFLKSHVELHLSGGAVLSGSESFSDYPAIAGRWEGIERPIHASLVTALHADNVSVTGPGTIDCHGAPWWTAARETMKLRRAQGITEREPPNPPGSPLTYPRPCAVYLQDCQGVRLTGFTVLNSPSWNIHPVYCDDVTIDGLTITAPSDSPNTDGIDPDSCRNVRIANCQIGCGDDGIIIKSGYNADGRRVGRVCENIVVTNCTIGPSIAAVGIGSETSGGVRNVTVSNCVFTRSRYGLRVKSARGRGAVVENFRASNIVMQDILDTALSITTYYDSKDQSPKPVDESTPTFRNIEWSNLTIDGVRDVAAIEGLPERFLQNVRLEHVTVRKARDGVRAFFVDGLHLHRWSIEVARGPAVEIRNSRTLEVAALEDHHPLAKTPVVLLTDIEGAYVHGCTAASGTDEFLRLSGATTRDIVLQANYLVPAKQPVSLSAGVEAQALTSLP